MRSFPLILASETVTATTVNASTLTAIANADQNRNKKKWKHVSLLLFMRPYVIIRGSVKMPMVIIV